MRESLSVRGCVRAVIGDIRFTVRSPSASAVVDRAFLNTTPEEHRNIVSAGLVLVGTGR